MNDLVTAEHDLMDLEQELDVAKANNRYQYDLGWKAREIESIPISVIQNKLEQNKAKTDCRYCNNACDSYAVCTVLKEILEKGNK